MPQSDEPIKPPTEPPTSSAPIQNARWHFQKGWESLEKGQWLQAAEQFTQVTQLAPQVEAGHFNLGNALFELGRFSEAAHAYERAYQLEPGPGTLNNLGNAWAASGQMYRAIECYQKALAHVPLNERSLSRRDGPDQPATALAPHVESLVGNLGRALEQAGRWNDAAQLYQDTWWPQPSTLGWKRLVHSALWAGQARQLEQLLGQVSRLDANDVDVLLLAATACHALGDYAKELDYLLEANQLVPDSPVVLEQMAAHQRFRGRHAEATICCHRALTLAAPTAALHSSWLRNSLLQTPTNFARVHDEAADWAKAHATLPSDPAAPRLSAPGLRMGFVLTDETPDYVIVNLHQVIQELKRLDVTCFVYSDVVNESTSLSALHQLLHSDNDQTWQSTRHLSDEDFAAFVRADRIDCLFDLSGHGAKQRLLVFARRAAPLQVSWFHIGSTSGLTTMDYMLADNHKVPDSSLAYFTERRLPLQPAICLTVPPGALDWWQGQAQKHLPSHDDNRPVVFGILCAPQLLAPEFISSLAASWMQMPSARLKLAADAYRDSMLCQEVKERFLRAGFASEQVSVEPLAADQWLNWLSDVDALLDPFPVGQVESVTAAVCLGLPVLAMEGQTAAGRMTSSILRQLQLDQWLGSDIAGYRANIERIASDPTTHSRQFETRQTVRDRLLQSALCNPSHFAQQLKQAITSCLQSGMNR